MQIILADHHPQSLWALKTLLQEKADFSVIGEAVNANDLITITKKTTPELALIDWELPGKSIESLINDLHSFQPRLIVVVMGSQPEFGRMMLKAGADAFVSKGDQPEWVLEALRKFTICTNNNKEK